MGGVAFMGDDIQVPKAPDDIPATEKRPKDCGATRWVLTLPAPELCPKIITLSLSPPNAAMFCCTHRMAWRWSAWP